MEALCCAIAIYYICLKQYWLSPGTPSTTQLKTVDWDVKNQTKQTIYIYMFVVVI